MTAERRTRTARWAEAAAWLTGTGLLIAAAATLGGLWGAAAASAGLYGAAVRRLGRQEPLREILERHAWTVGSCLAILFIGNQGLDWGLPGAVLAATPAVCAALETARR